MKKNVKSKMAGLILGLCFAGIMGSVVHAGIAEAGSEGMKRKVWDEGSANVYDVTEFGANGKDKGDDSRAINEALSKAKGADEPIVVKIPAGTYYIGTTLLVYSNTTITADPEAVLICTIDNKAAPQAVMVAARHLDSNGNICIGNTDSCKHGGHSQLQNLTIQGGTWDRNDKKGVGYGDHIRIYHGKNINLKDMTLKNGTYHFVNISGVDGALIENVTFKDQRGYKGTDEKFWINKPGDKIGNPERYMSMEVLHLDFTDDSGFPKDGTSSDNVTVRGCTFENIYAGLGTHHEGKKKKAKNLTVENNTFTNLKSTCINSYTFKNVKVSGNKVNGCRDFIWAVSSYGTVKNNTINNCSRFGMNFMKNSDYKVRGNKVKKTVSPAIRSESSKVTIEKNSIKDVGDDGIYIYGGKVSIKGNKIEKTKENGIFAQEKAVLNAENNKIKNTGDFGILIKNMGVGNVLQKNTISLAKDGGVYVMSVKKCSIRKNKILKSMGHSIFAAGTGSSKTALNIEGNTLKTASGEKRDVYLGKYCVSCVLRNNIWSTRGYTHDPSVKAKESGNKVG